MSVARWRGVLSDLWRLNRVHVGPEMSEAYTRLARTYPNTRVFGYPSGDTSGTWTVPPAWEVRHGRLIGPDGGVVADWAQHPLYLFAYSPSFWGTVSRAELEQHLMSDPARPNAIPFHFRNQYRHWAPEGGFCIPDAVRERLSDGEYQVEIDTRVSPGRMEMVEQVHAGEQEASVLFVGHLDHPAMCNDGLVGCLAGHEAITRIAGRSTRLTYRMLSTIEIVGSVFYAEREAAHNAVREALFLAASGARAPLAYQLSASGTAFVDRAVMHLLRHFQPGAVVKPFRTLLGNDEVAFDVGGVNIPCGSLARFPFAEYHTSDDTPDAVDDAYFEQVVTLLLRLIDMYERNARLIRKFSGLPCLSNPSLDLYLSPPIMSGIPQVPNSTAERLMERLPDEQVRAVARVSAARFFDLMNLLPTMSEGSFTTLDLAERVGVPFMVADVYTEMWVEKGLLVKEWVNPFANHT